MPDRFISQSSSGKAARSSLSVLVVHAGLLLVAGLAPAVETDLGALLDECDPASHTPQPDRVSWRDHLNRFSESLSDRQYEEAQVSAKQMIEYAIEMGIDDPVCMADSLTKLALAQRLSEAYEPALQNYAAAIGILETHENMLSEKLIEPLLGMGSTHLANGHADLALPAFDRALHLRHVNDGPHSLNQAEILDAIVTADLENDEPEAALRVTDRMQNLYAREFGPDSEELLPVLDRKADILESTGRYREERLARLQAVHIIESHRGESDLTLVDPYVALGRSYLKEVDQFIFRSEPTSETGETYLKKAVAVAERNADADWQVRKNTLMELGDYYTVLDVQDKARRCYRDAWDIMSSAADRMDQRRLDLERMAILRRPALDRYAHFGYRSVPDDVDSTEYSEGYVVALFSVNHRGRATDITIAASSPAGYSEMEFRVRRALRNFVYRPRYENGIPVATDNQQFRHEFLYPASESDD
jgi:tetratricopeptide (TPR) repeat protein